METVSTSHELHQHVILFCTGYRMVILNSHS